MTDDLDNSDKVDPFIKKAIDEFDAIWASLAKVEITAIKAASEANVTTARVRTYEAKLLRLVDENADLRDLVARLQSQTKEDEG